MPIEAEELPAAETVPQSENPTRVQDGCADVRRQVNDVLVCWIYGSSAAGKETFIRHVTADTSAAKRLRELLGWQDKDLEVIEASIQHIGQSTGDTSVENREEILEQARGLGGRSNLVILIKGQSVDLWGDDSRVERVRDLTPSASQQVIFLHVPLDELLRRCQNKPWWDKEYEVGGIARIRADLVEKQLPYLVELESGGFEVMALTNDESGCNKTNFPPAIE